MKYSAKQIAKFLNGEIEGNPKVKVDDVTKIEEGKPGSLSFLANSKYTGYIYDTSASVVLVSRDFKPEKPVKPTLIRVDDPYQAFADVLKIYNSNLQDKNGKEKFHYFDETSIAGENLYLGAFAYVGKHVKIGKNCKIYPHAYIGDNVCLGDNVTIFSGVKIYHGTKIGKNCIIHAGVVIGSDGFGFAPDNEGVFKKIEQVGIVHIKDDVEIGANTTIDRATMGETLIESGVKLDNLIHVAHNVVIGKHTVMAAQTGISGTAKIGSHCMFGGQVGISGHVNIGDKVSIAAQSGVPGDVKSRETVMGSPAIAARDYKRNFILQKQIPEMRDEIQQLKKEIARLKSE
ncbi:MAG: UDP-3-O-(3-hydroxymyristoyl)glucosamine N-acyltransferase [Bacteroidota bacterium]|nr:UDP-3-O-(3-hydroxymyristoyl)glucosamine N-acyltransferase [Bacteroidota bacterium]